MAGQGVFSAWLDPSFFANVRLGHGGSIEWDDEIDLCGDALYLEITGMTPEELFPRLRDPVSA